MEILYRQLDPPYPSAQTHRSSAPPNQSCFHQSHCRPTGSLSFFFNIASSMDTSTSPQPDTPQNNNCGNVIGSYNNTWDNCTFSVADKSLHILEWPSPLAPRLRHREVRRSHVGGVGSWLLRTDEFVNWNTGDDGVVSPVLFSYGDPGVGKTHIRYAQIFPRGNRVTKQ